jgi:hypothetical protein
VRSIAALLAVKRTANNIARQPERNPLYTLYIATPECNSSAAAEPTTMWSLPPLRSQYGWCERTQACASISMLVAACTRCMSAGGRAARHNVVGPSCMAGQQELAAAQRLLPRCGAEGEIAAAGHAQRGSAHCGKRERRAHR